VDFTAAWAANFAASLTLSLLASSPEAQHRGTSPATPGSSWSSTTPAGCPGRPQRSTWPEPPWRSRPTSSRRRAPGVRCTYASDPSCGTGMDTRLVVPPGW